MARSLSAEDAQSMIKKLEVICEKVKTDPNEAKRVLHMAGMTDETGEFVGPYRLMFGKK